MALFAIQLVRIVLPFSPVPVGKELFFQAADDIVIATNQMLNVIIIIIIIIRSLFIFYYFVSFFFADNIFFTWLLGHRTHDNIGAGSNEVVLR